MSTALWWALSGQRECSECERPLEWLEGPMCDPCLDDEAANGRDPLRAIRDRDAGVVSEPVIATPGRDKLAVCLLSGKVLWPR